MGSLEQMLVALLLVGCGDRALIDDAQDTSSSAGDAESDTDAPYPYCEWTDRGPATFCSAGASPIAMWLWNVDGDASSHCEGEREGCNTCLCGVTCSESEDGPLDPALCPSPTSGTATAECIDPLAQCWLTCDHGETCPDGMRCVGDADMLRSVCAWVRE